LSKLILVCEPKLVGKFTKYFCLDRCSKERAYESFLAPCAFNFGNVDGYKKVSRAHTPLPLQPGINVMKKSLVSFLLVVLIEAVSAIARYLKNHLLGNLDAGHDDSFESATDFS
jgi:hypothetical protein